MLRMMSRGLSGSVSGTRAAGDVPACRSRRPGCSAPGGSAPPRAARGQPLAALVHRRTSQRSLKRQPDGPRAGRRRAAGDAAQRPGLAQVRDRVEQRPRVGVRGVGEDLVRSPELGDLAGVHHRDPVGDVGDHGEVVGDVERRDAVGAAQLAHRLQHHALRRDVEAGGRLVEHEHLGLGQERHGQRDALHLSAGELVGVAAEELVVVRQPDLGQPVARALQPATRRCRARAAPSARRSACRCGWLGLSAEAGSCGT